MELRKIREKLEQDTLASYAQKSADSKGRYIKEEPCDIRTDFQRDRDRIIHSKAFRRMKHKTQVFISPEGDHYRTRLTHTLEVAQIARTIARALALNEDLTEAIALGHDLGHTPFGHAGERALDELCEGGFEHNRQSLRVVDLLEKDGEGLNLTWEVRDGILNHRSATTPVTLEGAVVRLSDKIAYTNHDVDDALRAGILIQADIPKKITDQMGSTSSQRINAMIRDTISNSFGKETIAMTEVMANTLQKLRSFLFQKVYDSDAAEKEHKKAKYIIRSLFDYYNMHPDHMTEEFLCFLKKGEKKERVVCDYIACMTDRFALTKYSELFIPSAWSIY